MDFCWSVIIIAWIITFILLWYGFTHRDTYYDESGAQSLIIGILCAILLTCGTGFWALKTSYYDSSVTIKAINWTRYVPVNTFTALAQDTLEIHMPTDAYNINRYTRDIGCGKACSYTEYRASYTIDRWVYTHDITTTGTPGIEKIWPVLDQVGNGANVFGNTRADYDKRHEAWTITFLRNTQEVVYDDTNTKMYEQNKIGDIFCVKVNRFEEIMWHTLNKECTK